MKREPCYIGIKELAELPLLHGRYTRVMPGKHLKFVCPGVDGLGITGLLLLLPETVVLFISPEGCARHVKLSAFAKGLQDKIILMRVTEDELVTGSHLERIPEAVSLILRRVSPTPKAIFIESTCIDTILASDYEGVCRKLRQQFPGVRFAPAHMDPIMFDSKKATDNQMFCSLFSVIEKQEIRDKGINILGPGHTLAPESDLKELLSAVGFAPVREMRSCKTLSETDQMGRSCLNIGVGPLAMACEQLERKHGIPYIMMPMDYDPDVIHAFYQSLSKLLGEELDDSKYYERAKQALIDTAQKLKGEKIVISKSYPGNPFHLAKTFTEYGINVTVVIKNKITQKDKETLTWLAEHVPELIVYSGDHPTLNRLREEHEPQDYVIGSDAAWYFPEAKAVLNDSKYAYVGYQGIFYLTDQLCHAGE